MQIYVSLSKESHIDAQTLAKTVGARVLDFRLLKDDTHTAHYAYVVYSPEDSGDYEVRIAKLRRQSLMDARYKLADSVEVADGFQTVHEASQVMEKLNDKGKITSLSAPAPLQSAVFQLSDFKIQMAPDIQIKLDLWARAQQICPIRYAVYNPRTDAVEVAFADASAHNSDVVQTMLRDSLYHALGDYSAGKNFDLSGRNNS